MKFNNESMWQEIVEKAPDHIMVLDLDYKIQYINRTVPDLTVEEVIGKSSLDFVSLEYHDAARSCFEKVISTGETDSYQTEYKTREGETRYFDVRVAPIVESEKVTALISTSTDITNRGRIRAALQISDKGLDTRNRISEIFLTCPDVQMYSEVLKVVLEVMESEFGTFGYFNDDGSFVVPAMTREIYWDKCNVPDKEVIFHRGTFSGIWGRSMEEKKTLLANEGPFSAPDGHISIKNTMVTPILYRGKLLSAIHVANKSSSYTEKDRQLLEVIAGHVAPVLNARLERDREERERKKSEEERDKLEVQILRAQKFESLSVLAGGIAHDFNNLLVGILGNVGLALMDMTPESTAREYLQDVEHAARRAADLAKQMLAYSGKGKFVVKRLDLQTLIEEMSHLLQTSISKKAVVKFDFSANVPPVEADPTQLRQIIMNLIINASEAIGDRSGTISIRTGAMDCDRRYLDETYLENDLLEGTYSSIEISDTGCGMDDTTIERMFEPFFSTKFTGRGLGLAAVLGIARGHGGAIKVYSEPGKGTSVKVLLPITEGPVSDKPPSELSKAGSLEGRTVMLVDDEETVRTVGRKMLERFGVNVLVAEDGRQAMELFEKDPGQFKCILLDLTMPHMDGEETFRAMRQIRKDICIVLSSGYNEQELINRFAGKGLAGFIQKPYHPAKLREVLLEVIDDE